MVRPLFLLLPLAGLLGACNMVISETPVFTEADIGTMLPRDGLWLADDPKCRFDSAKAESEWPECALWIVVRHSGREMLVSNGKGESERVTAVFTGGTPAIVQGEWIDEAKEPRRPYYVFYAMDSREPDSEGRFTRALVWPVKCGTQETPNGDIRPFAGISAECRPSSKDAIRSAAELSRGDEESKEWRWLRAGSAAGN